MKKLTLAEAKELIVRDLADADYQREDLDAVRECPTGKHIIGLMTNDLGFDLEDAYEFVFDAIVE